MAQYNLGKISKPEETKKLVLDLANKSSLSIDLHTTAGAYWTDGKDVEFAKPFPVDPILVTGAGDVWDSANTVGYLAMLDPKDRLTFANAAAALYIERSDGIPPIMNEALNLVRNSRMIRT